MRRSHHGIRSAAPCRVLQTYRAIAAAVAALSDSPRGPWGCAGAGPGRRGAGSPGPSMPATRPKRSGRARLDSARRRRARSRGRAASARCPIDGPTQQGNLEQGGPAARLLRDGTGGPTSRSNTTRATPKAAADRITAPTFSGSWNGTNNVHPSGQGSSSDQAGQSRARGPAGAGRASRQRRAP